MRAVSRFESDLLHILYALLGRAPIESILPRLRARAERPTCLSRDAVRLVEEALAKGCVVLLARAGGWRRERHLRAQTVVEGRLWERTPPTELALHFSRHSLEFLLMLTADWPEDWARFRLPEAEQTVGDLWLLYLAYEALRGTEVRERLRASPVFLAHGLCRLAFPEDFTRPRERRLPNWTPWLTGASACILEAWQERLSQRWQEIETNNQRISDVGALHALADSESHVLGSFLEAVDRAGRRGLALFMLRAAAAVLPAGVSLETWTRALQIADLRLSERLEAHRAALGFVRELGRLHQWEQQARTVGFFDDGYQAAQWWKAEWERHAGDSLWARAEILLRAAEPLRVG